METINLSKLAGSIQARENCKRNNNTEWFDKHTEVIEGMEQLLPSGSGIDAGCNFLLDECSSNKIVITLSFHHMNENGYYDGWTNHNVIITPSFGGFNLRITGKDKNMIKDYLTDVFYSLFE